MIDLFIKSYRAHYRYIRPAVFWKEDLRYFSKAYNETMYYASHVNSLQILKQKVKNRMSTINTRIRNKNRRNSYSVPMELALNIIGCLERRFE